MLQQTSHTRHVVDIEVAVARQVIMVAPVILGSPVGAEQPGRWRGIMSWTFQRTYLFVDLSSGQIGSPRCATLSQRWGDPAVMRSPVAMRRGDDVQVQSPVQQPVVQQPQPLSQSPPRRHVILQLPHVRMFAWDVIYFWFSWSMHFFLMASHHQSAIQIQTVISITGCFEPYIHAAGWRIDTPYSACNCTCRLAHGGACQYCICVCFAVSGSMLYISGLMFIIIDVRAEYAEHPSISLLLCN